LFEEELPVVDDLVPVDVEADRHELILESRREVETRQSEQRLVADRQVEGAAHPPGYFSPRLPALGGRSRAGERRAPLQLEPAGRAGVRVVPRQALLGGVRLPARRRL